MKESRVNRNKKNYSSTVVISKGTSKKLNKKIYRIFIISIIMNLILIGFFIFYLVNFDSKEVKSTVKKIETISPNYVFLGDSITEGYNLDKFYKDMPVVNSGISGNQTTDILNNMKKRVYDYNPSKVFILIGTNDIDNGKTNDLIVDNIKKIVEGIKNNRDKTSIYIESIYPVNSKIEGSSAGSRTNRQIKIINKKLEQYCNNNKLTYIDTFIELEDCKGDLEEDYTKDGLHLNDDGYSIVTKKLKKYLEE